MCKMKMIHLSSDFRSLRVHYGELLQWHAENAKNNPKIIHATERFVAGIIQDIGHFNLGPNTSPRDVTDFKECILENPAHEVVKFYLFNDRWRPAEIENCETYMSSLKASCDSSGVSVHPSGVEKTLREHIHELKGWYGDKQGTKFWVWVDCVLSTQIGSSTFLVNFDKWEQCGNERYCCATTAKIGAKEGDASHGFTWIHVQQTWLEGLEMKDQSAWLF